MAVFKPVINNPSPPPRPPHSPSPIPAPLPRPKPKPAPRPAPRPAPHPAPRPTPAPHLSPVDPSFLQWFTSIYQKFLGRAPEAHAIQDAWNAFQFFNAKGGDTNQPNLNLGPGGGGIGPGAGESAGGEDKSDIAFKVAESAEAGKDNRFAAGLNPQQALALINQDYESLLQRAPEQEAIEDAVVALSGGFETPQQFMQKILNSPEYLKLHPPATGPAAPSPPPPPTPQVTFQPGLVRAASQGGFDPNFAQNLAVFGGGALNRPGQGDPTTPPSSAQPSVAGGNLTFDPFASNPWGTGGQTSGGGNAPIFGTPTSLLQSSLTRANALPQGAVPPTPTGANAPPSTGVTDGTSNSSQQSPASSTFPSLVQIGSPTTGVPQSQQTSPAQGVVASPLQQPLTTGFKPGVPPTPSAIGNLGMLQF